MVPSSSTRHFPAVQSCTVRVETRFPVGPALNLDFKEYVACIVTKAEKRSPPWQAPRDADTCYAQHEPARNDLLLISGNITQQAKKIPHEVVFFKTVRCCSDKFFRGLSASIKYGWTPGPMAGSIPPSSRWPLPKKANTHEAENPLADIFTTATRKFLKGVAKYGTLNRWLILVTFRKRRRCWTL